MHPWREKVVLVTGGSAGLGLAIGRAWAATGARIVLAARGGEALAAAADSLRATGADVLPVVADVTSDDQVRSLVAQTVTRYSRLDVLVNNAGRSARGAALDTSLDEYRALWELNFLAAVRCAQAATPHLLDAQGHVVNIGSLAAKSAARYLAGYAPSKFALAAFSQQLRLELAPQGLHVLLVCPGPLARDDAGQRYGKVSRVEGSGGSESRPAGGWGASVPAAAMQPGGGVKLRGIEMDWLARRIVRACERRQPELVVPAKARLLFALAQLAPRLGDWLVRRMT